jgi:uncharacterized protein YdiU (UPF0061 family)
MKLKFSVLNDTFTKKLPADKELKNFTRQVSDACFSWVKPKLTADPSLIIISDDLLKTLDIDDADSSSFLKIVTGNGLIENSKPYAMCYGGHQFGNWAGQLGDGRAINLGQIENNKKSWTLQLKGSGMTPYSRRADGLAVLRSSVREFLCSEAMHNLGIATTRALSLSLTGDQVLRDVLYNGNQAYEPGAVVCRVAPSFIRFGSFEMLSARKELDNLKNLTDYTIANYYSHLVKPSKETYSQFFNEVCIKTADMIINWQRVGFVHGVMNTDNLSIIGQTIDYGPYGWIENFDEDWTPNTTDAQNKRYRFGNQASIALWNLNKLANALFPLIEEATPLEKSLNGFKDYFIKNHTLMLYAKLGISNEENFDDSFMNELFELLTQAEIDMTIFYRNLTKFDIKNTEIFYLEIQKTSYLNEIHLEKYKAAWIVWLNKYADKLKYENTNTEDRIAAMNLVNPKYVLRNYMAQLAIEAAEKEDYKLIHELYSLLKKPYSEQVDNEKWFTKRPNWALNKVGCSQLSCSS